MASMLDDLSLLTSLHRQVVVESGRADLLEITDELEARCRADDTDASTALVAGLDPDTTERIARLLTVHLHLTNLAEERQRARSLRREDGEFGGSADTGDIGPAVAASGPDARARIERMRIHPVLTAHPTEARRRAVASALRRIADSLDAHDDPETGPSERAQARRRMLEDIDILQRTSTLRITRPTPADEVKTVLTVFRQSLVHAVPRFQRAVEVALGGEDPQARAAAAHRAVRVVGRRRPRRQPLRHGRGDPRDGRGPRRPGAADPARRRRPGGPDDHRRRGVDAADRHPARRAVQRRGGPPPAARRGHQGLPQRAAPPEAARRRGPAGRHPTGVGRAGLRRARGGARGPHPGAGLARGRR